VGFQQSALAVGSVAAPIAFAAVAASSWRLAFALAAICPVVGAEVLRPLRAL
jgi:MFS family permease